VPVVGPLLLTGLDGRLQHRFDLRDRLPAVDRWHVQYVLWATQAARPDS